MVKGCMKKYLKKAIAFSMAVLLGCTSVPMNGMTVHAANGGNALPTIESLRNTKVGEYVSTIATPQNSDIINPKYDRSYDNYEVISEEGFLHPGILMNREELNIMRDMVWVGAEPWTTIFEDLQQSTYVALDYQMEGPYETIASDRENYALTRTSTAVYELTLMWYITGKQIYADRAIEMIMSWAETVKADTKQDHLRIGTSTHKLCIAAEILRYTPSSGWTEENTEKLSAYLDLINPAVDKSFQFYNQGGYALMAYMAKNIFQDNWDNYEDAVERFAYNKNFGWKGGNNVNYSISAMVFNSGQIVEMGRDQEHAWDDLGFQSMVAKTTYVQGTKVDEKGNIVSVGGSDFYEYENQKLLKAAAYWQRYCMGDEPPFVANQNAWGDHTEWSILSNLYRGQTLMWSPSLYYHYLYTKGYQENDTRTILSPNEIDPSEDPYLTYGDAYQYIGIGKDLSVPTYVRGVNVDFPDFQDLTFTPLAAIYDEPLKGAPSAVEIEVTDNCEKYNRYIADKFVGTGNGAKDTSVVNDRQNGGVTVEAAVDEEGNAHFVTSDVNNGEWVAYNIDFEEDFGEYVDTLVYTYGTRASNQPKLDVYVGEWVEKPGQADYEEALAEGKVGTLTLGPTGDYSSFKSFAGEMDNTEKLTGKKTVYFYVYGSDNTYAFHGNCLWFKFVNSRMVNVNKGAEADLLEKATVDGENVLIQDGGFAAWSNMDFDRGFAEMNVKVHAEGAGSLKLYVDGTAEEGNLVHTFTVSEATETLSFQQTSNKSVVGTHALYFVAEGCNITLEQFSAKVSEVVKADTAGFSIEEYTAVLQGNVNRLVNGGLSLDAKSNPYVTYMKVPFGEGVDTLGVKVKSTGENTLYFDQITVDPEVPGQLGRNGNVASFVLPDTTAITDDGYAIFYFDMSKTGANALTDSVFLGMGAEGNGTIEIQSLFMNPANVAPQIAICKEGTQVSEEREISLLSGVSYTYDVVLTDVDEEDLVTATISGELPEGFSYVNNQLVLADTIAEGSYAVSWLVTDGEVYAVETYNFNLQSSDKLATNEIYAFIEDSGIEDNLLTYYIYDNARYEAYINAKQAALATPADDELYAKLVEVVEDCIANTPVYTKIKFEYRIRGNISGAAPAISAYLYDEALKRSASASAATQLEDDKLFAITTEDLGTKQSKVKETEWISFQDSNGNPFRIAGNHNIVLNVNQSNITLLTFTLANEDETVTRTVDAITASSMGAHNNFCINALDNSANGGSVPHEVRGAATWLQYTWQDTADYADLEITGNSKAWPLLDKVGAGFDFELSAKVVDAVNSAKNYCEKEDMYTDASFAVFNTAFNNAQNAVENYEAIGLTHEMSNELAASLEEAVKGLQLQSTLVTIEKDENNTNILDFDATGHTKANGSYQSENPTLVATAGNKVSFLVKADTTVLQNAELEITKLGYRGSRGNSKAELISIEPLLSKEDVVITKQADGVFLVEWTNEMPGNYRMALKITDGTKIEEKYVEIIYRNSVERQDLSPAYVRMRFAGFREETKNVKLYLVKEGDTKAEDDLIATITSDWAMDAIYALTDWVAITWPADYDETATYQLIAEVPQRNTAIDFFEFATESYKTLYEDSCQTYPLSEAGVLRMEAEHYTSNTMTGFEAVDFNGKYGWENGTPGDRTGAIGTTSSIKNMTVTYDGILLTKENKENGTQYALTLDPYMLKGTEQVPVVTEMSQVRSLDQFALISSVQSVAEIGSDNKIIAKGVGETQIRAITNSNASEPVTLYVADKEYLSNLLNIYNEYLAGHEADYTTQSWSLLAEAVSKAQAAVTSDNAEQIYLASEQLKTAIEGRKEAASMNALNAYKSIAEQLQQAEYTPESWERLTQALSTASGMTKDNSQEEVNSAAQNLQSALYALEVMLATEADKTELAATISSGDAICEQLQVSGGDGLYYPTDKWSAFCDKLVNAKEILSDENALQVKVQLTCAELKLAMSELEDTREAVISLELLYAQYSNMSGAGYTQESFAALTSALAQANTLLSGQTAAYQQILDSIATLQNAVNGLTVEEVKPDKSALQALYDSLINLGQGNYTNESWNAFKNAQAHAADVLKNAVVKQEEIVKAEKLLKDARSYLVEKKEDTIVTNTQDSAEKEQQTTDTSAVTQPTTAGTVNVKPAGSNSSKKDASTKKPAATANSATDKSETESDVVKEEYVVNQGNDGEEAVSVPEVTNEAEEAVEEVIAEKDTDVELKADVENNVEEISETGEKENTNVLPIILIVAAVVILGGGAVTVMLRRQQAE